MFSLIFPKPLTDHQYKRTMAESVSVHQSNRNRNRLMQGFWQQKIWSVVNTMSAVDCTWKRHPCQHWQ